MLGLGLSVPLQQKLLLLLVLVLRLRLLRLLLRLVLLVSLLLKTDLVLYRPSRTHLKGIAVALLGGVEQGREVGPRGVLWVWVASPDPQSGTESKNGLLRLSRQTVGHAPYATAVHGSPP
ncbi:unnamed protein product [Ixodes hexagonus]